MADPIIGDPGTDPIMAGATCAKCHKVHNPKNCKAHSKRQTGGQCQRSPMAGLDVCSTHGGRTARSKGVAAQHATEVQIREALGKLTVVPVENPLAELQHLAGEARAWKETCAEHVSRLKAMRYGTEGGEAIRGEILLFERAMDRCLMVLATIAKLNIDERLVRIAEAQKTMVIQAIEASLASAGVVGTQAIEAKKVAARHLRVAA